MKWIVSLGVILLIAVLVRSTLQQSQNRYEVCVTFHGRTHCATAEGHTQAEAIHSAHEIDCTLLANGRDENMACLGTQPVSARPVAEK